MFHSGRSVASTGSLTWGFDGRLAGRQEEGVSACRVRARAAVGKQWSVDLTILHAVTFSFTIHFSTSVRTVSRLFLSCGSGHVSYLLQGTCCVGTIRGSSPFCWEWQSDCGSTSAPCILGRRNTESRSELHVLTSHHLQTSQSKRWEQRLHSYLFLRI